MLVHICCSVDSHYFLKSLKDEYPNNDIVGFFYDPNIHPYSEYKLRFYDVQYSCNKLGIKLIEGDYDYELWLKSIKGLENEPEKGDRCTVCFDKRLKTTVQKALELGHNSFTTTLLMSPLKSQDKLKNIGESLAIKYSLEYIHKDYRSGNGMHIQALDVKENRLYRQNYCGCMFGLIPQRDAQNKLCDELMCNISKQILPNSIEHRLNLYNYRNELESKKCKYEIIKNKILNYRLILAKVMCNKIIVPSYFIHYSTIRNKLVKGKIKFEIDNIYYFDKHEVKFITLDYFNKLNHTNYLTIANLIYDPLPYKDEIKFRQQFINNPYDLSCIIVIEKIPNETIHITCDSTVYDDTIDIIIKY